MVEPKFRSMFAASDGLCLPHLRRTLSIAEDEKTVRYLVEVAVEKLAPLARDLSEYVRKHDWNNRDEPKHPWEQAAWVRAVAFFAGEAPEAEDEATHQLRQKTLSDYRDRPDNAAHCQDPYTVERPQDQSGSSTQTRLPDEGS